MISFASFVKIRPFAAAAAWGSHVLLDKTWFPYLPTKKGMPRDVIARNSRVNWLLDAAFYGVLAWKFWPREAAPAAR